MRAGEYLAALEGLPFGDLGDITRREPFLVVSPHPDDETLGCGGLLAAATAANIVAHVLILTDGAASHPNSVLVPPTRLAALRREEARCALAELGLERERLHTLDLPDAAAPLSGPAFDAAVTRIVDLARGLGARSVFVTWGLDPHCDHEAGYAMALAAAARLNLRLWAYPIWGLHLAPDHPIEAPPPSGFRLDIRGDLARKRRAVGCYASQMTRMIDDDPSAFCFTEAQLAPFLREHETFIAVTP